MSLCPISANDRQYNSTTQACADRNRLHFVMTCEQQVFVTQLITSVRTILTCILITVTAFETYTCTKMCSIFYHSTRFWIRVELDRTQGSTQSNSQRPETACPRPGYTVPRVHDNGCYGKQHSGIRPRTKLQTSWQSSAVILPETWLVLSIRRPTSISSHC